MSDPFSLSGKRVLIVGGSRGIGAATALACASRGAGVDIVYKARSSAAESVVGQTRGRAFKADASDESEIGAAIESVGPLDGLVVCAGIFEGLPLDQMTSEFWDRTFAINVRATFLSVQAGARTMGRYGRGGSVVIITSTAGQRGSAIYSAYAASKAAQIIFMRSMAKELAPSGIRVNCIAPAWTETDMADPTLTELGRERVAQEFPLGRIGMPEDVASAATFLLSDAAQFITGSTITVDGGYDMRG